MTPTEEQLKEIEAKAVTFLKSEAERQWREKPGFSGGNGIDQIQHRIYPAIEKLMVSFHLSLSKSPLSADQAMKMTEKQKQEAWERLAKLKEKDNYVPPSMPPEFYNQSWGEDNIHATIEQMKAMAIKQGWSKEEIEREFPEGEKT